MKKFIFINNLWLKFLYQLYLWYNIKVFNIFKFYIYIKKFKYIYFFIFLYKNFEYKKIFKIILNSKNNLQLKNIFKYKEKYIQKKYIQKGYKLKKLGIYISNFENIFKEKKNIKKNINFIFLIRFKRKNLFLTLLNNEGNVLCKTNIGSCGFKKKVKYTGYAIKRTSRIFLEKITKSLLLNIYNIYYNNKQKKKKNNNILINYINNKQKLKFIQIKKKNYININNIKKRKKIQNNILKKKKYKIIEKKKKINLKILELKKYNLIYYRIYYQYFKNFIKKKLKITLRIKSSLKFWGFRFVVYGLTKQFSWFRNLEICTPIAHSTSLRLKKKRRI